MSANSLTIAIFISLCVFSITFAASATLIEEALKVPARTTLPYNLSKISKVLSLDAETILVMLLKVFTWSPGLTLSGLYPPEKIRIKLKTRALFKQRDTNIFCAAREYS